jgi:dihydrolipoamide dehydrogenase
VSEHVKLVVPDLGDFSDVEVIEILVQTGDSVEVEDGLVTLETDKASMDVPASQAGKIVSVEIAVGDTVSSGDVVAKIEVSESTPSDDDSGESWDVKTQRMTPEEIQAVMGAPVTGDATHSTQLVVIGSGPGGYTAAFRAADLGLDVILVEKDPYLGGVCLNVGCIPSKALLHAAKVIDDAAAMGDHGVVFGPPKIEAARLVDWKNKVVGRLTGGLAQLAKQRKVRVITATAIFESNKLLALDNGESIAFENCIIAAGSEPFMLPGLPDDPRIVDSTGALEVHPLPKQLLVVGGGIIGLEMACVYSALGVEVSVVELLDSLMPGTDKDLLRPFLKIVKPRYKAIMTSTNVTGMRATTPGIEVTFEGKNAPPMGIYDRVLVAVGRRANGDKLDAGRAGVKVDENGIIAVDKQMRTNVPHIFAIGDLAGGPMLAHKATHEAKVAAEVAAGEKSFFDARTIPSVAYTDPEIAWVGLTETEAREQGVQYGVAKIPWAASGRALSLGHSRS